ncbi:MAG: cytochrome c3 family protein [Planctomycetota bacterium]
MRNDELELAEVPTDDRPSDTWSFDADGQGTRTWTGRRQQIAITAPLVLLVFFGAVFVFVPRSVVFKPGPLSSPHAQILAGTLGSERCAACHSDATLSMAWSGNGGVRQHQNDLCMKCHQEMMDSSLASKAHNLPRSVREQLSADIRRASVLPKTASLVSAVWSPRAKLNHENVACSTCHKEHHGADVDLTAMTSAQCQSCHSVRFGDFANSHPEWDNWPYGRGGEIAFDHVSHLRKHANARGAATHLLCVRCHPRQTSGTGPADLARSASYENTCAVCHDEALQVEAETGLAMLHLPTIPPASAQGIGWPDVAVGFPDGVIPPLTELLLRSDPDAAEAMRKLPGGDIAAIKESELEATANVLARSIRKLLADVSDGGHAALLERLVSIGIAPETFLPVIRSLPPQWLSDSDWFEVPGSPALGMRSPSDFRFAAFASDGTNERLPAVPNDETLLDEDLLSGEDDVSADHDALLGADERIDESDPLSEPDSPSDQNWAVDPASLVARGGWYRDDVRLALRYRGTGHADKILVSLIETFAQLSQGDPLRDRFFELPSVASCVECHRGATRFPPAWRAAAKIGDRTQFTKFSHAPHLSISSLDDCSHCHRIADLPSDEMAAVAFAATDHPHAEFHPIRRESCAACHTSAAAGDDCATCHRYHISR